MSGNIGSQTVFRSDLFPLASGPGAYLAVSSDYKQPLCGNKEGWGPLSPYRYDFTPCFLDVWVAVVAVFGLVGGCGAIWYLFRKHSSQPVRKNWHFYAKLVSKIVVPQRRSRF